MARAPARILGGPRRLNGRFLRRLRTEILPRCLLYIAVRMNTDCRAAPMITCRRTFPIRPSETKIHERKRQANCQYSQRDGNSHRAADYVVGDRLGNREDREST